MLGTQSLFISLHILKGSGEYMLGGASHVVADWGRKGADGRRGVVPLALQLFGQADGAQVCFGEIIDKGIHRLGSEGEEGEWEARRP